METSRSRAEWPSDAASAMSSHSAFVDRQSRNIESLRTILEVSATSLRTPTDDPSAAAAFADSSLRPLPASHIRTGRDNNWLEIEIAVPRRARRLPFKAVSVPWVSTDTRAVENAVEEIDDEHDLRQHQNDRRNRDERVSAAAIFGTSDVPGIGIPPRLTDRAQDVHREEDAIEADERDEEMHFAPELVHLATEHFWEPEIDRAKHAIAVPANST